MNKDLKLIIVDDDADRLDIYESFVEAFNTGVQQSRYFTLKPIYCFSVESALEAISNARGLTVILLDMVRRWPKDMLRSKIVESGIPVIALSEYFNSSAATAEYTFYARERLGFPPPIIHFRDLRLACDDKSWSTVFDVFSTHIASLFGIDGSLHLGSEDPLNIVHMTDVHMDELGLTEEDLQDIGDVLSTSRDGFALNADFVAVTGDVTNRGGISTYSLAVQKFKGMLLKGWMRRGVSSSLPSGRIFVSPGNHDFSEQLGGANVLSRGTGPTGFVVSDSLRPGVGGLWRYGLVPFMDFHRSLSGAAFSSVVDFKGYRANFSYISYRLAFIEVWAQSFRVGSSGDVVEWDWLDRCIQSIRQEVGEKTIAGDVVVILMHHLSTEDPDKFDSVFLRMLAKISRDRTIILLTGHLHTSNAQPISFDVGRTSRVLHVRSDTMNSKQVRTGCLASFAIVSLKRKSGVVVRAEINRVFFDGAQGWNVDDRKRLSFDLAEDGWRMV